MAFGSRCYMKMNCYGVLSIRNRILVFAVLVTLVPSLAMGWLLHTMLNSTLQENVEQKLLDSSHVLEKEIAIWFKEREYDIHVFSNSYIITENLAAYSAAGSHGPEAVSAVKALDSYLTSVQRGVREYSGLSIYDASGNLVATSQSDGLEPPMELPADAKVQLRKTSIVRGNVVVDPVSRVPRMLIGLPLYTSMQGGYSGILAVEVNIQDVLNLIRKDLLDRHKFSKVQGAVFSLKDGRYFFSTGGNSGTIMEMPPFVQSEVKSFEKSRYLKDLKDINGIREVGLVSKLPEFGWGLIIAEDYSDVFARSATIWKRNILIVSLLAVLMGIAAYLFTRQIILPLRALAEGARDVAGGRLDIRLPIKTEDELGFTTRVFNEMVVNLKTNRAELERLATTDPLTKLDNRKMIMQTLHNHFGHFRRYKKEFAVLMIDVDHFKAVNDTYGHLAGDVVLKELASIFNELLRSVDSSGRYGGEEFLVVLAETTGEMAVKVAERIRKTVQERGIVNDTKKIELTVSIGVAMISEKDHNEENLIGRADAALYKAKKMGRNRVIYFDHTTSAWTENQGKVVSIIRPAQQ